MRMRGRLPPCSSFLFIFSVVPRNQEIRGARWSFAEAHSGITSREGLREFRADAVLHALHAIRIALFPLLQIGWHFDSYRLARRRFRASVDRSNHTRRIQVPFCEKPVRCETPMQRTGGDAVQIGFVLPANRSEPVQIEMCIAQF